MLGIQGQGVLFSLPCFLSFIKKMVKQPAAFFEPLAHCANLFLGWVDAVSECFTHEVFAYLKSYRI